MEASTSEKTVQLYLNQDVQVRPYTIRLLIAGLKKRAFDLTIASLVTAFILIWLIPLLTLLIKLSSPGPALYIQMRTGRKGRIFPCLKFRTMTYETNVPFRQATPNDRRVTRIGKFLRKTNLDEMPQFLNVLAGHMSVVGPRPHPLPLDAEHWNTMPGYKERYIVRPGITGLAQARGARGETAEIHKMKSRVRYDHLYIRRQSTRLDATICWWTITAAVRGNKNAY
ncbi:sugar transferase [Spirosoma endophyticum]|uniref:Putative colanic acid biosysnthesis UDP-glucose lipid carrier transferase n=1 Tax=Spirosoma endophyticum TaxID=662367 RepID=A0A1I2CAF7_9BACT|nr:sugar transferase [Spirosoma endophyticum]SFE65331.1 putative colanic acid biosysnthesis UDP-glucose lipid carrier transferase [Spirosoma endophyticum]